MKIVYVWLSILTIGLIFLVVYSFDKKSTFKTGYFVMGSVYDGYKGSKELRQKVVSQEGRYKLILDSLKLEIDMVKDRTDALSKKKNDELVKAYTLAYNQMRAYSEEYIVSEETKIWTQINKYVEQYGKEKGFTYLYGASGNGSIMYADTTLNVTSQVIEYINLKYSGK